MITQIMINFPQILVWPVRPCDMFSTKFGLLKTDLWAKKVGKFLYKKLAGGHSFANLPGCHNMNVQRFSKPLNSYCSQVLLLDLLIY